MHDDGRIDMFAISGLEILTTNGLAISGTAAQFAAFTTIRHNSLTPGGIVSLSYTEAGSADLSASVAGVDLWFFGTTGADAITSADGADILRGFAGDDVMTAGAGDDQLHGNEGNDLLYGGDGADLFYGDAGDDTAYGGAGADIIGGQDGDDTLSGEDGDDVIYGDAGDDVLDGGAGNDGINGGTGNDTLIGGDGDDTLVGFDGDDTITGGEGNDKLYAFDGVDVLDGGAGNDELYGGSGVNTFIGGDGDDIIYTGDGGAVATSIDAGAGDDTLYLFTGPTGQIRGGDGTDEVVIYSSGALGDLEGFEILSTGGRTVTATAAQFEAFDTIRLLDVDLFAPVTLIVSESGVLDLVDETSGRSVTITGASGADTITLGDGQDTIDGGDGDDVIDGGAGNDVISGGAGNDTLTGGDGDDRINDGGFGETSTAIAGGAGNDTIVLDALGLSGTVDGGANTDELRITGTSLGTIVYSGIETLSTGANTVSGTAAQFDAFASIRVDAANPTATIALVLAEAGALDLTGQIAGAANLLGSSGDDAITTAAGDDTIEGGAGNDMLAAGAGTDVASYASATAGVTVSLALSGAQDTIGAGTDTLSGFENLTGSAFDDVLTGDAGANTLSGGGGNDRLQGLGGINILDGGEGHDIASYADAAAAVTVSLAVVGAQTIGDATDTFISIEGLAGSAFNDVLTGGEGDDTLEGDDGDDTLDGGAGADIVVGGVGADVLSGGDGADRFLIADGDLAAGETIDGGEGIDTIVFGAGAHVLDNATLTSIEAIELTGSGPVTLTVSSAAQAALIVSAAGDADTVIATTALTSAQVAALAAAGVETIVTPPNAQDDALSTDENTAVSGSLFADNGSGIDEDGNGDALTITDVDGNQLAVGVQIALASGALLTVNADGTYSYDPNGAFETLGAGDSTSDGFAYTVSDGNGGSDPATTTITIAGVNDAPTGAPSAILVDGTEDVAYTISAADLLAGFSDVEGDTLSVANLTASAGAIVDNGDGTYTITPTADFNGAVTLTYDVIDGQGGELVTQSQSYSIASVNDAPIGAPSAVLADGAEDTAYVVSAADLLAGFSDADLDTLSVANLTASDGAIVDDGDGTYTITPTADFNGSVTLTFDVVDGNGGALVGQTQSYTLAAVNDAPTGAPTTTFADGTEDTAYIVSAADLLAGFSDADLDALSIANLTASDGAIVDNGDGTYTITPTADFNGSVTLTYDVIDGQGGELAGQTQSYTIASVNDAPIGAPSVVLSDGMEDRAYVVSAADLLAGFSDVEGDTLSVANLTASDGAIVDNGDGTYTITPTADFNGAVTLTYDVIDGQGGELVTQSQSYTIASVNDAPIGAPSAVLADGAEDTAYVVAAADLLAGFSDVDLDTLSVANLSASNGGIVDNGDGTYTIMPTADFNGTVTLTYDVIDGQSGALSGQTLSYMLAAAPDAPDARDDALSATEGAALTGSVFADNGSGADVDADGETITVVDVNGLAVNVGVQIALASGALLTVNADGTYSYDDNGAFLIGSGQSASDGFTYTISDGGASDTATVSINVAGVGLPTIVGSDSAETLSGSGASEALYGFGGNDMLFGRGGGDLIDGGAGRDRARYDQDTAGVTVSLVTGQGAGGEAEGDTLVNIEDLGGGRGNDHLIGDEGPNYLFGAQGDDSLEGGDGDDMLFGGSGADTLDGGAGRDRARYDLNAVAVTIDLMTGVGAGGDAEGDVLIAIEDIVGSSGDDRLMGDDSANYLIGNAGDDQLEGRGGNDMLIGGAGADTLNGGAGRDRARYDSDVAGVTVNLATGVGVGGEAEGDTLIAIEDIGGGTGADRLIGDAGVNYLFGWAGDDILAGGEGGDMLFGGAGADTLIGGEGRDRARYDNSATGVIVDLGAGTGLGGEAQGDVLLSIEDVVGSRKADTLTGDGQSNYLIGAAGDDTLFGQGGDDMLIGGAGADHLDGGAGIDRARYESDKVGVTVDLALGTGSGGEAQGDTYVSIEDVAGGAGNDHLIGDGNANRFWGANGNDVLDGGAGDDRLDGDAGDDRLEGGAGADFLMGGTGADTFVLDSFDGVDTIADFSVGEDVIELDHLVFGALTLGALSADAFAVGSAATTLDHRLLYDPTTGELKYDVDGAGGEDAIVVVVLGKGLSLTAADFEVG
jgi:Ca2+-binding RTX toxin-like protein